MNVRVGVLLAVAVLASMVVFLPSAGGTWILDDIPLIAENPVNQSFAGAGRWFTQGMWDLDLEPSVRARHHGFYRPLVLASYALDWLRSGGEPLAFHVTNILLHGVVVTLAALAVLRWSGSVGIAFVVALLFGVHPAKAENVAWISGRTDVFVALGILLASWGIALRGRGRRVGILVEAIGTVVAYLSKELAVALPIFAMMEVWHLSDGGPRRVDREAIVDALRRWVLWVPQLVLALVYLFGRKLFLPLRGDISGLPWDHHLRYVAETIGRAMTISFYPDDLSLYASAIRRTPEGLVHHLAYEILGVATVLLAVVLGWTCRRRVPAVTLGVLGFFASALPVLNVVFSAEANLIAPRFLYLPSLFLFYGLVAGMVALARSLGRPHGRRVMLVVLGLLAVPLVIRGWVRATDFLGPDEFYAYELAENPDVPDAIAPTIHRDLREGEYRLALARSACAHRVAEQQFNHRGSKGAFILLALRVAEAALPDLPRDRLAAMAQFLETAAEGRRRATLDRPIHLVVPPDGRAGEAIQQASGSALILAARLWARVGRLERARSALERGLATCTQCRDLRRQAARVRPLLISVPEASDLGEARGQVAQLMRLELWGRALAVLRPFVDEVKKSGPDALEVTTTIALRAGDEALAEELLQLLPPKAAARVRQQGSRPPEIYDLEHMGTFVPGGCALPFEL